MLELRDTGNEPVSSQSAIIVDVVVRGDVTTVPHNHHDRVIQV